MGICEGRCQQAGKRYFEYLDARRRHLAYTEKVYPPIFYSDDYIGTSSLPIEVDHFKKHGRDIVKRFFEISEQASNVGHSECDGLYCRLKMEIPETDIETVGFLRRALSRLKRP